MNFFDPILISVAHQRALQIEKQLGQRSSGGLTIGTRSNASGVNRGASSSGPSQRASVSGMGQRASPTVPQPSKASSNGVRCFGCAETSLCLVDCKKQGKKALFANPKEYEEEDAYVGEELVFDDIGKANEEVLEGDIGPALVVRRMCFTPYANEDDWLRNNIFQSTCTI